MSSKYFPPEEAAAKLGKQVWARRHFDGMPQGTVGKVIKTIERDGGAALLIEWQVRAALEDVIRDSWSRKERTPNLFNKHLTELSRAEYKRYTHDEDNPPFDSRVAKWMLNLALFVALVMVVKGVYAAVTSGDARELREVWTFLLLGSFIATIARIVALSGWLRWSRVWGLIVHFFSLFFVPAVLLLFGYELLNGNTQGAFGALLVGGLLVFIQHALRQHRYRDNVFTGGEVDRE